MAEVEKNLKSIAITGATGLLGSYLVAELIEGGYSSITLLLRRESQVDKLYSFLRWRGVNQRDIEALKVLKFNMANPFEWSRNLKDIDTLYHCAATVAIGGVDPQQIIAQNRELTLRVVDGAIDAGVSLLVHVSSIATLGSSKGRSLVVNERMRIDNFKECSAYSVSKFYAENQVLRGAVAGLKSIIVHPAVILGASNVHTSSSATIIPRAMGCGLFYTTGVVGYVDVKDVVRAMVMLSSQAEAVGNRYLLSSASISYKELISSARRSAGARAPLFEVGRRRLKVLKSLLDAVGVKLGLTSDLVRNLTSKTYYDGTLIVREFGFDYTPIEQTIDRVVQESILIK